MADALTVAALVILAVTSLGAATVNGALGYGYSSITVPVSLMLVPGRVLNPALVVVEAGINLYALWWTRRSIPRVIRRVAPLALGLIPGVVVGAALLGTISVTHAKVGAFVVLLPLILLRAAGHRLPIRNERRAAVPFGAGVGLFYGLTTISGPPLALFWNNQGLAKDDFKVALALVRTIESMCALVAYAYLGLLTRESAHLLPWIVPGVLVGFPIGHWLINHISVETFRRVCMSFDAYLVSFGLARTLAEIGVPAAVAYQLLVLVAILDTRMLWLFFRSQRALRHSQPAIPVVMDAA